jgi:hypothetical protein
MRIVIIVLFLVHGLITASQARGSFNPGASTPNPQWLNWWPTVLGRSWFLARFGLEKSFIGTLAGVLWLIAAACLIAAALGLLGFIVPVGWWRILAGIGATLSLLLLALYGIRFMPLGLAPTWPSCWCFYGQRGPRPGS